MNFGSLSKNPCVEQYSSLLESQNHDAGLVY